MSNRGRLLSLMAIMALVVMVAVGISIAVLYRASFEEQRARLNEAMADGITFELARKPLSGDQIRLIAQAALA